MLFLVNLIYFLYIRSYISCELGRRPSLHSYIPFLIRFQKSYIEKVYKTAPKAPFSRNSRISGFFRPQAEKLIYKKYIRLKSLIHLLYISFEKSYIEKIYKTATYLPVRTLKITLIQIYYKS